MKNTFKPDVDDRCVAFIDVAGKNLVVIATRVDFSVGDIVWLGPSCFVIEKIMHDVTDHSSYCGNINVFVTPASRADSLRYKQIDASDFRRMGIDDLYGEHAPEESL